MAKLLSAILLFSLSSTTWASLTTGEGRPDVITRGVDRVDLRPHIVPQGKEGLITPEGTSVMLLQDGRPVCVIDNNAEASAEIVRLPNCTEEQFVQIESITANSNNVQVTDTGVIYQIADIGVVKVITNEPITGIITKEPITGIITPKGPTTW